MEKDYSSIRDKLIEEQDLVSFYAISSYNKSLGILQKYSEEPKILYSELKNYIINDIELLKSFSTDNLIKILSAGISDETKKQNLVNIIMERLEKEDFFCEDVEDTFFMKPFHSVNSIFSKLGTENTEKIKKRARERIQKTKGTAIERIADKIETLNDAANFLRYFEQGIFTPEKISVLEEMIEKNENALRYCNFGIFQDEIFEMGSEFIKYISKFPGLSAQLMILQKNNPQLLRLISSRIEEYESLPDNYDELEILITYFTRKCFDINLDKVDERTTENLIDCALLNSKAQKDDNIINIEYVANYKDVLNEQYTKMYENAQSIEAKRNIYFNRMFSISTSEAQKLIEEYGSDLDNIQTIEESDKEIFSKISAILDIQDESVIDELFSNGDIQYRVIDILSLKHRIAKECALDYSKSMNSTDESIKELLSNNDEKLIETLEFEGQQIKQIRLNGNFNLLVHSTDSGFIQEGEINEERDFVKAWNNGTNKANHIISSCYINQDFLGCAPVNGNGVMYGFTTVQPENIRLMGVTDINTYSSEFAYNSKTRQYMSAKTMPYSSRRVYSEFGLERENTIPDYVILFDDMDEQLKENTYRAAMQFGIPVLFVDKKEIEQQQIKNLHQLIEDFGRDGDIETLKQLLNTYETNVAGWLLNRSEDEKDESHTMSIDNSHFKEDFSEVWNNIYTLIDTYIQTMTNDGNGKNNRDDLIRLVEIVLEEIDLYKGSQETKPITKTSISFDAKQILQKVNQGFEDLGINEYKIDLEHIPTAREYRITTQQIGKATIYAPTVAKKEAEQVENGENTRDNIIKGEEVGDGN